MADYRVPDEIKKVELGSSINVSPTTLSASGTLCPSNFKEAADYDCEALQGSSSLQQHWFKAGIRGSWRTWLGINGTRRQNDSEIPITRNVDKYPLGYPQLATFLSSDDNFGIYRRFGCLHSRILLNLQDQIVCLERELDAKDEMDRENGFERRLRSRTRDEHESQGELEGRSRTQILDELRQRLAEYDELLVKSRDLLSFRRPSDRDHRSVFNWIDNKKPLVDKEQAYIRCKEDVITLYGGREWCGFDEFIESSLSKLDCQLIRWIFCDEESRSKTKDKDVHYYTRSRVNKLVGVIITSIIFILLVLPVVAMYKLTAFGTSPQSIFSAIGVLIVFTLLFSAAMSIITKAQRHELFAASAAYCAVLVVFISNFGNISTSI